MHRNHNTGAAAAAAMARDTTRLEPQVCFILFHFFYLITIFFRYMSKQRWEQQRQQLETHDCNNHTPTLPTSLQPNPRPPQQVKTATQEQQQQQWLETRHVLSHRYVFFYFSFYFITLIHFSRST